ncbi:(d)CMP kinase [Candidatus Nitrosotenuis uzonensis]|uniref:Cytidylate kinase n=1 Tax=Candidatus Nitrosotenuis uzonensis TaxID=1407055 RepID=V6ART5_9ARCH|nr:cytidylate kinase family protein [Candidatus Nitrosotenuis uzonensis]CDI05245.1 putative adenylate kinase [Candidatus Nitrosotenuis uzonensis]
MPKSIIVSGPPAIGKTTVSKGLAKEFGMQSLSGGDVLKELAKEQGFKTERDDWWDTKDGMKFLDQRKDNYEFDRKVDERLKEIFLKGNVVITSYTLPWLVKGGIKIWLGGSRKISAERMQTRDNMSHSEAFEIVKKRYDENKMLYKKLYGFDFGDDLSVFDIVIDTDGLDAKTVLNMAIQKARALL